MKLYRLSFHSVKFLPFGSVSSLPSSPSLFPDVFVSCSWLLSLCHLSFLHLFQWYFLVPFCACLLPLFTFSSHRFCLLFQPSAPQFFSPNISLSFSIWFPSPSTNVYFLAPILLSTFPFQVLLCLISVFIFFYFVPAFLNSDWFKILQEKLLLRNFIQIAPRAAAVLALPVLNQTSAQGIGGP